MLSYTGHSSLALIASPLYPRKNPESIASSVFALRDLILGIKLRHPPPTGQSHNRYTSLSDIHRDCSGLDFSEQIKTVLAKPLDPVLDSHRVHMKAQMS